MRLTTFILLAFFTQTAISESNLVFSPYTTDLRINEINGTNQVVTFVGEIETTGTLVFRLDMISETEFGDPISIDFLPDSDQLARFPQVIKGFHPKALDRISLFNAEKLYTQLYGEDPLPEERELRLNGTIKISSFTTSVECDTRQYLAKVISFKPSKVVANINSTPLNGC